MTTANKTAAFDEAALGKQVLTNLATGAGVGVGGMALWQLIRALKPANKKETSYQDFAPGAPTLAAPDVKTASSTTENVYNNIASLIGSVPGRISDTIFSPVGLRSGDELGSYMPNLYRDAFGTAMNFGALGGGVLGGGALVNSIVKHKDKQEAKDEVEKERQRYYAILSGQDKSAAALDAVYEKWAAPSITDVLSVPWNFLTNTVPHGVATTQVLASLAAAGVGGKYMYDRTAERTRGENVAKARASRARMRGLPDVYVDPDQLAQIKQMATQPTHE